MEHTPKRVSLAAYARDQRGFSMAEFLLVLAVVALIGGLSFIDLSRNVRAQELEASASQIRASLERARGNALAGQDARNWGVYFDNAADDTYQLFSSPTNYADMSVRIVETVQFSSGISFANPTEGNATEILFTRGTGQASPAGSIQIENALTTATVSVSSDGRIE